MNLPVTRIKEAGYTLFSFDPLKDSASHDYYFFLTIQGTGTLEAATGPGDSYLQGALYQNGVAQEKQLNFHLQHQTGQRLLGLGLECGRWLGLLLLSAWLFIVPGWALLPLLGPSFGQLSWAAKIGLAAGLTLAVYPLLFLWTDLIGFHWGPYYAWIPSLRGITAIVWRNRSRRPGDLKRGWSSWVQSEKCWPDLAMVSLLGLICLSRIYVIRVIEVPMWGDSYHHTLISQLLVDHKGLFNNWEPYADLRTFTYHFGFHTAVALFHWTTGFDLPKA
ncbi:MAG TPA: hypothetical protein VLR91_04290, partial [Thermodesulfobacteriota bacterium]|nr:hypothetical protein [Thermodesulfobacteriota bacterium]